MIEATNIFTEPAVGGRIDIASAAQSSETAMLLFDIDPGAASCPYHYEYVEEWLLVVVDGEVTVQPPDGERVVGAWLPRTLSGRAASAGRLMNRGPAPARMLLFCR